MNSKIIILLIALFIHVFTNKVMAELSPEVTVFQLQFQKSLFVSGEKIWFKNTIASGHSNLHQTILYVDLCDEGAIINSCIVKRENNHWQGDLLIPDSLQTGIYLFRAYTGNYDGKSEVITRLITVINRFGNNKTNELRKLRQNYEPLNLVCNFPENMGNALAILTNGNNFETNSPVEFIIEKRRNSLKQEISFSVFKIPENEDTTELILNPELRVKHSTFGKVKIFNKLTLSGKVIDKSSNETVENEIVLFSIPDSVPQINYSVTDAKGEFIFEIDDYYGTQDVIVQTLTKDKDFQIIIYPNLLDPPLKIPFYLSDKLLESEFVMLALKRAEMGKAYNSGEKEIRSKQSFKYPFYGYSSNVLFPDRYIYLDNFEEISKELLPLSRIKKEKDEVVLKIYDTDNYSHFEKPWIIIDGVPVFDTKIILPLNSQKIKKIETVAETRCFGGLLIDGALSVFTKDGLFTEVSLPKNSMRRSFETFYITGNYENLLFHNESLLPDFRDVLCWEPVIEIADKRNSRKIWTSYEKGRYIAIVQALDEDGTLQRSVCNFRVN